MLLNNYLLLGNKFIDVLNKYDEEELKFSIPKEKIISAVQLLEDSLKIIYTGKYTEDLATADSVRDDTWYCFYYAIVSATFSQNENILKAGELLLPLVKNPDMRIYKMGYQKESASLKIFFNKIDSNQEYTDAIASIGITELYQNIKKAQNAFEVVELNKIDDEADKVKSESNEACKNLRAAIDDLDKFIEVASQMTPNDNYNKISAEINEIIAENNALVSARTTRRKNAKEEEVEEM